MATLKNGLFAFGRCQSFRFGTDYTVVVVCSAKVMRLFFGWLFHLIIIIVWKGFNFVLPRELNVGWGWGPKLLTNPDLSLSVVIPSTQAHRTCSWIPLPSARGAKHRMGQERRTRFFRARSPAESDLKSHYALWRFLLSPACMPVCHSWWCWRSGWGNWCGDKYHFLVQNHHPGEVPTAYTRGRA